MPRKRICRNGHDTKIDGVYFDKGYYRCRKCALNQIKKHSFKNKERNRRWYLKHNFNLTLEQYNEMRRIQNYACYICKVPEIELDRGLAVDHSHETNKVRKLLCGECNHLLGQAKESIKILEMAIAYLKEHSCYVS